MKMYYLNPYMDTAEVVDIEDSSGDKISQLVILPIITPTVKLVDEFPDTDRGDNGFGSTGR